MLCILLFQSTGRLKHLILTTDVKFITHQMTPNLLECVWLDHVKKKERLWQLFAQIEVNLSTGSHI